MRPLGGLSGSQGLPGSSLDGGFDEFFELWFSRSPSGVIRASIFFSIVVGGGPKRPVTRGS